VVRFDGNSFVEFTAAQGLPSDVVYWIQDDMQGNVWFATDKGASRFDGHSFINYTMAEGLISNNVRGLSLIKVGRLWMGTFQGINLFNPSTAGLTSGKLFSDFTDPEGRPFHYVSALLQDASGNMWISVPEGLWKYDGSAVTNMVKDKKRVYKYVPGQIRQPVAERRKQE
jgi:ligand-binding sensor domain-containing protein